MKRITYLCFTNDDFIRSCRNKHPVPLRLRLPKPEVSTQGNRSIHRLKLPFQREKRQHRKQETGTGPKKKNRMKRSITTAGVRFRGNSLLLIFFFVARIVRADSARFGRCLRHVRIPVHRPGTFVLLPACTFRHRRPVHCAKYRRRTSLPCLRTLHPQTEMEPYPAERCKYLLWVYVWFYLAWGLNYSQKKNFYERTRIPYTAYTPDNFRSFTDSYIENLNSSYTDITSVEKELVCRESVRVYNQIGDSLGVHRPFHQTPRAKTMLFTH